MPTSSGSRRTGRPGSNRVSGVDTVADIDAVTEETERVAEPAAQTRPSWRWRVVGLAGALLAILLPVILWNTGPYGPLALPPPPGPAAGSRAAAPPPARPPRGPRSGPPPAPRPGTAR